MWFGLLGAPAAWVTEFLVGYGSNQARCNPAGTRWGTPVHTVTVVALVAAAIIALLGWFAAFLVLRGTESGDDAPPEGRIRFLGIVGATTSFLFLMIIVWSGVGALILQECHQS
jgi:hypothetical protein